MRLFILLSVILLARISYGDMCSDLHQRLKVGGTIVDLETVQSQKVKEAYQRILHSPEARSLTLTCGGSAIGVNGTSSFGGFFLLKGDAISEWLLRKYALDGDSIFEDVNTRILPWQNDEFGPFTTLNLSTALVPARIPGLVGTSALFDTYGKVIDEVYSEQVSVLVDRETREALVYKHQVNE